ncbi:MAG: hypothetical protein PHQ66_02540 [Candidatus Nanoarchaeia archaeon]|nr:hypothetical protein [Candidatus Nanoarchaeia archaeon]MDD5357754.1 hypothetical protein [Candidatus Nanoarchaeia archaeon]MDD5588673.1 hypothetical protein [Candidatus Nanoarchaeia archaeon]
MKRILETKVDGEKIKYSTLLIKETNWTDIGAVMHIRGTIEGEHRKNGNKELVLVAMTPKEYENYLRYINDVDDGR